MLIVEDDMKTSQTVALYLRHAGYTVEQSYDGETALKRSRDWQPDLVILDLMLPKIGGLAVCRGLREQGDIPIIMLTARTTEADRLRGLESGADDYVSKPFSPRELVARVKTVMRRRSGIMRDRITFGDINLDADALQAYIHGTHLTLTVTEFRLLLALCARPNTVQSREALISAAFGADYEGTERAIDVHIRNLRRKLTQGGTLRTKIRSVFGVGYRIECDA